MKESNESIFAGIVKDLQAFLKYLASLWGLLSLFSVVFPLVNSFHPLIPLPDFNPDVCVLLSTLGCLFIIFFQFTNRRIVASLEISERVFFYAVLVTFLYLVLPQIPDLPSNILPGASGIPLLQYLGGILYLIWLLLGPLLYILIFYLFTRLFTILAVKVWQSRENEMHSK